MADWAKLSELGQSPLITASADMPVPSESEFMRALARFYDRLDPALQGQVDDRRWRLPGSSMNWGRTLFGANPVKPGEEVPWFGGLADDLGARELWK